MKGDRDMSFEDFQRLLKEDRDSGIEEIFLHSDYTIINNGSESDFIKDAELLCIRELGLRDHYDYKSEGDETAIRLKGSMNPYGLYMENDKSTRRIS